MGGGQIARKSLAPGICGQIAHRQLGRHAGRAMQVEDHLIVFSQSPAREAE